MMAPPRDYGKIRKREQQRAWLLQVVAQLQNEDWYGEFTVIMEAGVIQRLKKVESVLPPTSKDEPGKALEKSEFTELPLSDR